MSYCVFCEIADHREPAAYLYEDERVVAFRNRLNWVPVMLLVIPRRHLLQEELWTSDVMSEVGRVAVALGHEHCPHGFRLLSNFGTDAMQSQYHAHVHVVGGTHLGEYA